MEELKYVAKYFPWKATGSHWNAQGNNLNNRIEKGELSFYQVSQVINFGSVKYYGEKNPKQQIEPNGMDERNEFYEIAKTIF